MSDVWKDVTVDFENYPTELVSRLGDLFGLPQYKTLNVYDQREFYKQTNKKHSFMQFSQAKIFILLNQNY